MWRVFKSVKLLEEKFLHLSIMTHCVMSIRVQLKNINVYHVVILLWYTEPHGERTENGIFAYANRAQETEGL